MTILMLLLYIFLVNISIFIIIIIFGLIQYSFYIKDRVKIAKDINDKNISKDGYSEKKISESITKKQYDAIFIGSGISSLTNAALLSRLGYKVLVLEQHDIAGGCTHSFIDKGYEFDTGLHYVGGNVGDKKNSLAGYLFDLLSLGKLKWDKMDYNYDTAKISSILANQNNNIIININNNENDIKEFDIYSDIEVTKTNLIKHFPQEELAVREYFNLLGWCNLVLPILMVLKSLPLVFSNVIRYFLNPFLNPITRCSTKDVLNSCTKDIKLQGILSWLYGDYGLQPNKSSFLMNAVITNHFIEGKAFYPNGGTGVIAQFFIPIIKAAGGDVFVRANVTKIILKNNTAIGVEIKGNFKVYARLIISGAGVLNTYNKLITVDQNNNFANKARSCLMKNNNSNDDEHLEKSCSMYTTFIGLNIKGKTMDELQIKAKNIWTFPSWDHDLNFQYYDKSCNDPCNFYMPLVFLASSSAKDKSWSTRYPDKIVFEMLTVADYNAFSDLNEKTNSKPNHRSDKYKNCKKIVEERMLKVFAENYPQLVPYIDYVNSGTPITNNFFLGSTEGEVYGLSHTPQRFSNDWLLRPKQGINNLYLTGQDIICDGICGGLCAGVMTSIVINPLVLLDLFITFILEYL